MTTAATLTSFSDLCDYLRGEGVVLAPDPSAQVCEIPTSSGLLMYLRWERHLPLLQIVHVALAELPAERLAAAEHAISRINHAAPLAGFALDLERRFAYFRITVQRDEQDHITVPQLSRALHAAVATVGDALPLLHAAVYAPAEAPVPAPLPPAAEAAAAAPA